MKYQIVANGVDIELRTYQMGYHQRQGRVNAGLRRRRVQGRGGPPPSHGGVEERGRDVRRGRLAIARVTCYHPLVPQTAVDRQTILDTI